MDIEEIIDEIVADIASGLIDMSDEEIEAKLDEYDLDPEDKADILESIKDVRDSESLADGSSDSNDIANQMATEDDTDVTVEEEDSDEDGDVDKVTIKKESPEEDLEFDFEDDEDENSSEEDDEPHDEDNLDDDSGNYTNEIAKTLSNYRW